MLEEIIAVLNDITGADAGEITPETELFEESRHTPAPWQTEPMSREYLKNILQRGREIARQTLEDVERETVGYISPDAKNDIDKEISEMQEEDAEDSIGI